MSNYKINPSIDEKFLSDVWCKVRDSPSFWGDLDGSNKISFIAEISKSVITVLTDFGFAHLNRNGNEGFLQVHMVFWSLKPGKDPALMKHILVEIIKKNKLKGIETIVPVSVKSLQKLLPEIGFTFVSVIPGYYQVRGELYDGLRYVMMNEEE